MLSGAVPLIIIQALVGLSAFAVLIWGIGRYIKFRSVKTANKLVQSARQQVLVLLCWLGVHILLDGAMLWDLVRKHPTESEMAHIHTLIVVDTLSGLIGIAAVFAALYTIHRLYKLCQDRLNGNGAAPENRGQGEH